MTEQSTQDIAREAADWFETSSRASVDKSTGLLEGESYVRVRVGAPKWVSELVREAHGRDSDGSPMLPDDYRYAWTSDALEYIADSGAGDDLDDLCTEFADNATDSYTSGRLAWLASNLRRVGYVDEARSELGPFDSVINEIGAGMYLEAREVFGIVLEQLGARAASRA